MAGFTAIAETEALVGLVGAPGADKNNYISLHTADGGDTGANEVSGGAYARQPTDWPTPAASTVTGSSVTIQVPAGTTITHWGLWKSAGGTGSANFLYSAALPAPESFGSNGTYSVTPTIAAGD